MVEEAENIIVNCNMVALSNIDGVIVLISDELLEVAKSQEDFFTNIGRKFDEELKNEEE